MAVNTAIFNQQNLIRGGGSGFGVYQMAHLKRGDLCAQRG